MVFPASVRDAYPVIRVNHHIGSVKPPRGMSKTSRSQEFLKILQTDSSVKIWIAEDTIRSIERSGIAPVQDSDSLRCHVAYSHGPENNQHCEGNSQTPRDLHKIPPYQLR